MTVTIKKRKFQEESATATPLASASAVTDTDDFGQRYHCDACAIDITRLARIRCAECEDYDLCIECFLSGQHPPKDGGHRPDHSYRVMELLDFPLFEQSWGADEELLLVEGLETYGMGNWEQISEHIGTKTKHQVARHYQTVYVNSPQWPLPRILGPPESFDVATARRSAKGLASLPLVTNPKPARPPASAPVNHEIQGYMPGRLEFEYEYENDAEQVIKDMEFLPDERREDVELKLALLHRYNEILDVRRERKDFIARRNMLEFKKLQAMEKKRSREEKDVHAKYRVFAKTMTIEDYDTFIEGMVAEAQLLNRIAQLQDYRRMGLTTLKAASVYEKERALRDSNKALGLHALGLDRSRAKPATSALREDASGSMSLPPASATSSGSTTTISPPKGIGAMATARQPAGELGRGNTPLPAAVSTRKTPGLLDISNADSVHLITEREREICSTLRIYPKAYIVIKETILKENALRAGRLGRRACRKLIKIDVSKTSKLYDFFVEMGWIKLTPPPPPPAQPVRKRAKVAPPSGSTPSAPFT